MHRQFGHCSFEKLVNLLKKADKFDLTDKNSVREAISGCEICERHGRSSPKPIVSLPLSEDFNDTVAMDLHQLESSPGKWYFHIIDIQTRCSQACMIKTKSADEIVQKFNKMWILNFGAPKRVLSDNGGEFDNEKFRQNSDYYSIHLMGTAANSPFSKGCCERHNKILTEMFLKLSEEQQLDEETCLHAAVFAKNCMSSHLGYSPFQLVYGKSPRVPTTLDDELPALDANYLIDNYHLKHLKMLHSARRAFVAVESSDRVRRALRANVREVSETFTTGTRSYTTMKATGFVPVESLEWMAQQSF